MHSSRMRTARSSSRPGGSPSGTPREQKPPCKQTHACKHITLPQTSFAGGNKKVFQYDVCPPA